jgi:RNA-directed DNA polymerase
MCWSRSQAERALSRLTELLAELGLEPKAAKTRIVQLEVGGEGFDFLGFHHRLVRSPGRNGKRPFVFLARWPADKAMRHARDRVRHVTDRRRRLRPEAIAKELNVFLRGWSANFRYGQSATASARSGDMRGSGWRTTSVNGTVAPEDSGGGSSSTTPTTSA